MTQLVQFELTPKNPNSTELTSFLANIITDTLSYPGCKSAKFFSSLDEQAQVILLEEWDKKSSFNEYLAWRTKRGDFSNLLDLLDGPPKLRHFSDNYSLVSEIRKASNSWKAAFNAGDAQGCAAMYEDQASLNAKPIGNFTGTEEITQFWQNIISEGYNNVQYIEPHIEVINPDSAILRSKWKMNKASGKITKELWVLQADGSAKLRQDDFEIE